MKKIIILVIVCIILVGCENKNTEKVIDISSDEYFSIISNVFNEATKNNEYLHYSGYSKHYPYIQVSIKPLKKISEKDMKKQSEIIENEILSKLRKYKYKSGGIFKYNYEYINIYFYNYNELGQLNRNEGPFMQFEILKI